MKFWIRISSLIVLAAMNLITADAAETKATSGFLNSRYSISPIADQTNPVFIHFKEFRVLPNAEIRARVTYGLTGSIYLSGGRTTIISDRTATISGRAARIAIGREDTIKAVFKGRGKGLRFRFRVQNFRNRPSALRGKGWVEFRGRRHQAKISNFTDFQVISF